MTSTGTAHATAIVAAPIRKLCPAYFSGLSPDNARAFRSSDTSRGQVSGCPLNRKRGPSILPRTTRYVNSAATTGHRGKSVLLRTMDDPCRKGSVFDCLIRTDTTCGFSMSSTVMSLMVRCWPGSNSPTSEVVISPDLRNPKNPTQHAAHSIMWLWLAESRFQHFALKIASKSWSSTYQSLLSNFNLPTLSHRRSINKITQLFKINHGFSHSLYPPPLHLSQVTRITRSFSPFNFAQPFCRTSTYLHSFYPSAIKIWNSLPEIIKSTNSLSHFKFYLTHL